MTYILLSHANNHHYHVKSIPPAWYIAQMKLELVTAYKEWFEEIDLILCDNANMDWLEENLTPEPPVST